MGTERRRPSGDPRGPDTHLDESVVTNRRETVTSQRTDFQNRVFELRFPHSQASKTSERWTSLMFAEFTDNPIGMFLSNNCMRSKLFRCQSNFTNSSGILELSTFIKVMYLFSYTVTSHSASLSSNGLHTS